MTDDSSDTPGDAKSEREAEEMAALVSHLTHPTTAEDVAEVKRRLVLRRRPRWLVRGAAIGAIAAAAAVALFFLRPPEPLPAPDRALVMLQAEAAKNAEERALDPAMDAYRRTLLQTPRLKAAEPTYTKVDDALHRGDVPAARALLTAFVAAPPDALTAASARVLQRDALSRLAALDLRAGAAAAAVDSASRGLTLGNDPDMFTVNLLLTRASAHRALGDKRAEAADLHDAITILSAMLEALLGPE